MKKTKETSEKKAVFPNLAEFVVEFLNAKRDEGAKVGVRVMREFHLYDKVPKKIFGRDDKRHAVVLSDVFPGVACRYARGA